jgi:metal-responsive CopG/Arc/MetJ family transcriptional regulator
MSKHRLQLDFTEEALRDLDQLRDTTGLPNRAEVIRQALRFLQWTIHEAQENEANLLIEKDGKLRQIVFPFWSTFGAEKKVAQ